MCPNMINFDEVDFSECKFDVDSSDQGNDTLKSALSSIS